MYRVVKLPKPVAKIYEAVLELSEQYPGRSFTPDGHLVGSIGEVVAKEALGLIALVTVVRPPRFRTRFDQAPPPPGLLRVERLIKGTSPRFLTVALPDPCLLYFQRPGQRVVVAVRNSGGQPYQLAEVTSQSLRRRNLGRWRDVR